jgi:2-dehydro-3-deoxygluconokinase
VKNLATAVEHGAPAMTTPGDTSMASLREVENLMKDAGARLQR